MQTDGAMSRSEANKRRYNYLKHQNRCVWCGERDAYTMNGRALCAECCEYRRALDCQRSEKRKAQIAAYQKERRIRLEEAGLCIKCGKREPRPGLKSCDVCLEKYRGNNAKKPGKPLIPGMCSRCRSKPVMEGRRLCEECYESVCRGLEKARAASAENKTDHPWRKYWEERK